jgi:hypothetical protein
MTTDAVPTSAGIAAALPTGSREMAQPLMKAIRVHALGGIEALSYENMPRPVAESGQVLVRLEVIVIASVVGTADTIASNMHYTHQ